MSMNFRDVFANMADRDPTLLQNPAFTRTLQSLNGPGDLYDPTTGLLGEGSRTARQQHMASKGSFGGGFVGDLMDSAGDLLSTAGPYALAAIAGGGALGMLPGQAAGAAGAAGAGAGGAVAPWGAGEAVSGAYGAGAGAGAAGAGAFGSALGAEGMGLGSGAVGADVLGGAGAAGAGAAGAAGGSMDFGLGDFGSFDPGGAGVGDIPAGDAGGLGGYPGQEGGGYPGEPTGQYGGPTGLPPPSNIPDWLKPYLPPGLGGNPAQPGAGGASPGSQMVGNLGGALLGYLGSSQQRQMFQQLADRYWGAGADYRNRLAQSYADPNAFLHSPEIQAPVQQGTDIMARSLSTQGNPAQSGNALQQLQNYSANTLFGRMGEARQQLGNFGGLQQAAQAGPAAASGAIGAAGNQYNAIGAGVSDIFNPPRTLAQNMNDYQRLSQNWNPNA